MSKTLKRLTNLILLITLGISCSQVSAFYSEIYKQQSEDYWEKKRDLDHIDLDSGRTKEALVEDAKKYILVCPDLDYKAEDLDAFWYDEVPKQHTDGSEPLSLDALRVIRNVARDCIFAQASFYQAKKALEYYGVRTQEKVNEEIDDQSVEDMDPQGDDYDFFASLRENIKTIHGDDESQKITDFTYFDESEDDQKSPEPPKNLYQEGRPLEEGGEAQKSINLEVPGQGKGEGGLMKVLTQTIGLLQEVNKTPKKAQQTALLVFESGLAGEGKDFGEHYSKPFFFLEWVPNVTHYPLFLEKQYDHDIWEEVSGYIEKIIDEDPCQSIVKERLKDKLANDNTRSQLESKCVEYRAIAFQEDLHRQKQASQMKRLFMDAEYWGKQLTRDVENYEQLAYLVYRWKETTVRMAGKKSIAGEPTFLQNLAMRLFSVTAQAEAPSKNEEDHFKCTEEDFPVMKKLIEKAREDLNKANEIAQVSAGGDFKKDSEDHTINYNQVLHDEYQLYLQYLKWTLFPESMRKQFDEYYKLVGKLDSALFQSNKAGVEELQKVTEIVDFHLSVVDNLFPYVIMPERVVTGSSSHDIEEFQSELEEGLKDSIAALQREFDWGRMRYCADKDIFKNIDPSIKPEDIQKDLLERPKIFNAYVNAGEGPEFIYGRNVKQEKDGDVRDKRRAPTIGTFNPQTFCSAQARQEDESREEKEIDNFFESVIGFYDKLLSFFQSDDEKAQAGSQDGYGERYELLANEKVKQTSRRRKRTHQSQLNCMTQYYKNLHQFDQFQLEMEEERFKNALVPIIKDSNTILNSMKVICKKHNVLLGCPLN